MKRLLIISQTYPPDPAAVGQHIADVASRMASRGWRVTVFTSRRGYDDARQRYPWRELRDGVDIRRLPFSSLGKSTIAIRLLAQAVFIVQALCRGILQRGISVVLVSTSPPFAGIAGCLFKLVRGWQFVWWVMDINPDQLVASGKARPSSPLVRFFDWMNRRTLNAATRVIALDRYMAARLLAKADVRRKMAIVPPWSHDSVQEDISHDDNPFRSNHKLKDAFVVMYSGNHGYSPLDTVLAAAHELRSDKRIKFMFIGGGVGKVAIDDLVRRESPPNIISLPYQPLSDLRYSLSSADVHVVSLADHGVGIVHPCKIYGALAVGRPIIALGPRKSYVGDILAARRVGWLIEHGEVVKLVSLIRELASMAPGMLKDYGIKAREAASIDFSRERLVEQVCVILEHAASTPKHRGSRVVHPGGIAASR